MSDIQTIRADRRVIEAAAAHLRRQAILSGYSGLPDKHYAFALAAVLNELGRHARGLDDGLRATVAAACRSIVGDEVGQDRPRE